MGSYSSSLTIEETAGLSGKSPRKFVLTGPSLPFQGAEWGFQNQLVTTWYPGNPVEATQQNLGPRELNSSWEGVWKRTQLGQQPALYTDETGAENKIVDPFVLRDALELVARAGGKLRVTWAVTGAETVGAASTTSLDRDIDTKIIREGRVKSLKFPHDRHSDIRWSIEFEWLGRGGQRDSVVKSRDDADLTAITNNVLASLTVLKNAADSKIVSIDKNKRKSATKFTLAQLQVIAAAPTKLANDLASNLRQVTSDFNTLVDIAQTVRTQPAQIANTAVDLARNTIAVANKFSDTMSRTPPETLALKSKTSDMLRTKIYFDGLTGASQLSSRSAQQMDSASRRIALTKNVGGALTIRDSSSTRAGDIIDVYITKQGDSPQRISIQYYQSPDFGNEILKANKMPSYTPSFTRGTILIIPVLRGRTGRSV